MHLPSHALVNLTALDQWTTPELRPYVLLGAVAPDLPVLAFYFVCRFVLGLSDETIWQDVYYEDRWFNVFATFHSLPVTLAVCGLGLALQIPWLTLLAASMVLHNLADFPLHAKDAHRHFYPLSNYRFKSPVSYWNPRFWGRVAAAGEVLILVACSAYMYPRLVNWWAKAAVLSVDIVYVGCYAAFYLGPYGKNVFNSMAPD